MSLVAVSCKRECFIKIIIMLTIKQIRENKAFTLERLAVKGVDAKETVDRIEALDDERKSLQGELEACCLNREKRKRLRQLNKKRLN